MADYCNHAECQKYKDYIIYIRDDIDNEEERDFLPIQILFASYFLIIITLYNL